MKRWLVLAFAAIAIAALSTASFAAVQGTHHDMSTWLASGGDTCYPCHGIQAETGATPGLGPVGDLCYARCHGSNSGAATTIPIKDDYPEIGAWENTTRQVDIVSYSRTTLDKYGSGAHGLLISDMPAPDTAAMVTATGFPYTDCTSMQCTSCHDVHSNANTPFLRVPLDCSTQAEAFCQKCHAAGDTAVGGARWVTITMAPNGSHPSEVDWTAASTRATNGRRGRTIVFKDTNQLGSAAPSAVGDNAVFRNLSPWGATLNAAGPSTTANRYNPGGKLARGTLTGVVGCYTCHATHLPSTAGNSQLIVAKYKDAAQSTLCIGCHGGNGPFLVNGNNKPANPGTTSYFHPVEYDSLPINTATINATTWMVSTGAFQITVNLDCTAGAAPIGAGTNVLLCASCHTNTLTGNKGGVHNAGGAGDMLLSPAKPTCESCHNTVNIVAGTTANSHHVYGGSVNYNAAGNGQYVASVNYNGTNTANLTDGLQCNDCHTFNGTAHNWN